MNIRKQTLNVNDRVNTLLANIRLQCTYRSEALNTFINESFNRINRVFSIHGYRIGHASEELKIVFLTQLEKIIDPSNREFLAHQFKRKRGSNALDYDAFKAYMIHPDRVPLLSSKGLIAQSEEITICNKSIRERRQELIKKQNAYVGAALTQFMSDKIKQLNDTCKLIKLKPESVVDIRNVFVEKLEKFNFNEAYVRVGYQNNDNNKFERTLYGEDQGLDIEYDDFNRRVSRAISYQNPDQFITMALCLTQEKEQFECAIKRIEEEIGAYAGSNKKNIISTFQKDIQIMKREFSDTIKQQGFFKAVTNAKSKVENLLSTVQQNEDAHYQDLFFFAQYRKSHSTLQPKINEARKIFDNIQIGEHGAGSVKSR